MFEKVFESQKDFEAYRLACDWCKDNGISSGSPCRFNAIGLLFGDYTIAKWNNLTPAEIQQLHGTITGGIRHGPVMVFIKPEYEDRLKKESASGDRHA